jgi:putative ABC transport system substrate-binding protein
MRRRDFIAVIGGAALTGPSITTAQQPSKLHRVAYVGFGARLPELIGANPINPVARAFKQGMNDLGYVEGKNLLLEWRTAEGQVARLPEIMRELVSNKVDVIVSGGDPVTEAAQTATRIIPIVMTSDSTPVERGLAQCLARPGGNITGLTFITGLEVYGKRVQLLKELAPNMKQLAWLIPPFVLPEFRTYMESASRQLGLRLLTVEHAQKDYTNVFALLKRERPDALYVSGGSDNYNARGLIVEFAAQNRLPAAYYTREFVDAGGLMSYGATLPDLFRRAAGYVDKILKGAKPADLPIELPSKFELVISKKTAAVLGLTIPPTMLAIAEVIE